MIFLSGYIQGLVQADAGYISSLYCCGMVEFVLGEGDGEVLNAMAKCGYMDTNLRLQCGLKHFPGSCARLGEDFQTSAL